MTHVYIALGSNIEPRQTYLSEAIHLLDEHNAITVKQKSSIYQTKPVGYTEQADFLNMVVHVTSSLSASALLDFCQSIEQDLGRKRGVRFGPRTIDLDLLWYNNKKIDTDRLMIPHPRMTERAFVLIPLFEIAPELIITGHNQRVEAIVQTLSKEEKQSVIKWTDKVHPESEE